MLHDVTFTIDAGGRLLVLGRSGSGKTSLLRLLNRFDEPLAGQVRFHGKPLAEYDPLALRRRVAFVLQTPIMFEGSVRDNLRSHPAGSSPPGDERIERALDEVQLETPFLDRAAVELSVGEKQRVALARALLRDPEVLLLDEPTSSLDPQTTTKMADLILALQAARALTIVLVTHQPELARRMGEPVLLLGDGTAHANPARELVERFLEGR